MYGIHKTTVYLPDDLKPALARVASERGQSEAELIREVLRREVAEGVPPSPNVPLFASGKRRLAERVDKELAGFGEM